MLNRVLVFSSVANILGGAVLFLTWAVNWATDPARHVPIIVLGIGGAMVIQGVYTVGYSLGWWGAWGDIASGALLGGQLISGCAGVGLLVSGIAHNSATNDIEMAPVIAGLLIGTNALIALILLVNSGKIWGSGFSSRGGSALL
ncbi:MAG: hypothetical protein M3Z17_05085 [Gemmatimonadota bacterium]|nr:hypothetical protein [Gemmatimonadota bacterium]